jgi:hypothetical protein
MANDSGSGEDRACGQTGEIEIVGTRERQTEVFADPPDRRGGVACHPLIIFSDALKTDMRPRALYGCIGLHVRDWGEYKLIASVGPLLPVVNSYYTHLNSLFATHSFKFLSSP